MILFDELNVIGEISKFNMISEKGRRVLVKIKTHWIYLGAN